MNGTRRKEQEQLVYVCVSLVMRMEWKRETGHFGSFLYTFPRRQQLKKKIKLDTHIDDEILSMKNGT